MADLAYGQPAVEPLTSAPFTPAPPAGFQPRVVTAEPSPPDVQRAVEGVPEGGDRIEFIEQWFRIADDVGTMPMLAFAAASKKGLDVEDMEGMAAMYAMIRDVIHRPPLMDTDPESENFGKRAVDPLTGKPAYDESEWQRFEQHAVDVKATGEELFAFVGDVMAIIAARPPQQRAASSRYSPRTSPNLKASSSSPGTRAPDGMTPVSELGRSI